MSDPKKQFMLVREAFLRGFVKGLAGPVSLFEKRPLHSTVPVKARFVDVYRLARTDAEAIASDWNKVGEDIRSVVAKEVAAQN